MKVTVTPEGVVELDVSNGEVSVALDFIEAMRARAKQQPPKLVPKGKPQKAFRKSRKITDHRGQVQPALFDALKWLAQNDSEEGLRAADLAQHARISNGAAGQRLIKLAAGGFAYRVKDGRYRAVKPPQAETPTPASEYSQSYGTGHGES